MTAALDRASWNHGLIDDVRTNGKPTTGPFVGRHLLLLTTRGAKSGEARSVACSCCIFGCRRRGNADPMKQEINRCPLDQALADLPWD